MRIESYNAEEEVFGEDPHQGGEVPGDGFVGDRVRHIRLPGKGKSNSHGARPVR